MFADDSSTLKSAERNSLHLQGGLNKVVDWFSYNNILWWLTFTLVMVGSLRQGLEDFNQLLFCPICVQIDLLMIFFYTQMNKLSFSF